MTASWTYITDATLTKDLMGLRGVRIALLYGDQYDVTREHWYILEHHPRNIAAHIGGKKDFSDPLEESMVEDGL